MNKEEENLDFSADKEDIISPFLVSKTSLVKLMRSYIIRKFDMDLAAIERQGGITWIERALQTDLQQGLNSTDDQTRRIQAFGSSKINEEPLSNKNLLIRLLALFC
jgi:hypothetical protein